MELLHPYTLPALAGALLLLTLLIVRRRQRPDPRGNRREELDTVAGWPPEAARILTSNERQAYELLRRSLPGYLVLAQVPLSRFLRVPTRHSYNEWLHRVGSLSADLVVCDFASRVLAVVDIRAADETPRSRRRHERLARVLKAARVQVFIWREDDLPAASEVRSLIGAALAPGEAAKGTPSRPMPLIPVPEIEEVLVAGDMARYDTGMEPVPSMFIEENDSSRMPLRGAGN